MANSVAGGSLLSGEKTVTSAGTAEALGTGIWRAITIIAKTGNTGQVYVGGDDVDSNVNDGLDAGEVLEWSTYAHEIDLAKVFVDADTNGEGVDFYASH